MDKPMTKAEWINWLEKAWDEAQKAAWSETPECKTDPRAPHGFDRNASHSADRYVCECEGWEPPTCPPCHGDCDQGRNCNYGGALPKESFGELAEYWKKYK
jgi:hypothetical protein